MNRREQVRFKLQHLSLDLSLNFFSKLLNLFSEIPFSWRDFVPNFTIRSRHRESHWCECENNSYRRQPNKTFDFKIDICKKTPDVLVFIDRTFYVHTIPDRRYHCPGPSRTRVNFLCPYSIDGYFEEHYDNTLLHPGRNSLGGNKEYWTVFRSKIQLVGLKTLNRYVIFLIFIMYIIW